MNQNTRLSWHLLKGGWRPISDEKQLLIVGVSKQKLYHLLLSPI